MVNAFKRMGREFKSLGLIHCMLKACSLRSTVCSLERCRMAYKYLMNTISHVSQTKVKYNLSIDILITFSLSYIIKKATHIPLFGFKFLLWGKHTQLCSGNIPASLLMDHSCDFWKTIWNARDQIHI